jgi:hypothetical protein
MGCGKGAPPTAQVSGAVTIKGAPVPADASASISFAPVQGGESVTVPIVDSRYVSPTTPRGAVAVKFYISRANGPEKISERTGQTYQDISNLVPPEHASGMVLEIGKESVQQDFQL